MNVPLLPLEVTRAEVCASKEEAGSTHQTHGTEHICPFTGHGAWEALPFRFCEVIFSMLFCNLFFLFAAHLSPFLSVASF